MVKSSKAYINAKNFAQDLNLRVPIILSPIQVKVQARARGSDHRRERGAPQERPPPPGSAFFFLLL